MITAGDVAATLFFLAVVATIQLVILYYLMKAAARNALRDAGLAPQPKPSDDWYTPEQTGSIRRIHPSLMTPQEKAAAGYDRDGTRTDGPGA